MESNYKRIGRIEKGLTTGALFYTVKKPIKVMTIAVTAQAKQTQLIMITDLGTPNSGSNSGV